jgi:hypothetical protein
MQHASFARFVEDLSHSSVDDIPDYIESLRNYCQTGTLFNSFLPESDIVSAGLAPFLLLFLSPCSRPSVLQDICRIVTFISPAFVYCVRTWHSSPVIAPLLTLLAHPHPAVCTYAFSALTCLCERVRLASLAVLPWSSPRSQASGSAIFTPLVAAAVGVLVLLGLTVVS